MSDLPPRTIYNKIKFQSKAPIPVKSDFAVAFLASSSVLNETGGGFTFKYTPSVFTTPVPFLLEKVTGKPRSAPKPKSAFPAKVLVVSDNGYFGLAVGKWISENVQVGLRSLHPGAGIRRVTDSSIIGVSVSGYPSHGGIQQWIVKRNGDLLSAFEGTISTTELGVRALVGYSHADRMIVRASTGPMAKLPSKELLFNVDLWRLDSGENIAKARILGFHTHKMASKAPEHHDDRIESAGSLLVRSSNKPRGNISAMIKAGATCFYGRNFVTVVGGLDLASANYTHRYSVGRDFGAAKVSLGGSFSSKEKGKLSLRVDMDFYETKRAMFQ